MSTPINLNQFLVYRASAGSGKTYTIAMLSVANMFLAHGKMSAPGKNVHRRLLAVTFTNDATDEMKRRILKELWLIKTNAKDNMMSSLRDGIEGLQDWTDDEMKLVAGEVVTDILHDFGNVHIVTIDSFLQNILRQLAHELHIGSRLNLDLDTESATSDAVKQYISLAEDNNKVRKQLTDFLEETLEDGKSWNVQTVLEKFGQKMFNETYQASSGEVEEAVKADPTLFNQVGSECRKIISDFKTEIVKLGNKATEAEITDNGVISNVTGLFRKIKAFGLKGEVDDIYSKTLINQTNDGTVYKKAAKTKTYDTHLTTILKEVRIHIEANKTKFLSAIAVKEYLGQFELLSSLSATMHDSLKEDQRFMLSDTAFLLSTMIQNDDAPFIFERMDATIDNVLIDEAQDTSMLQWRIFETFVKNLIAAGQFGMMVGDVKQSIYRWRNSDWHILNDIQTILGLTKDQLQTLGTNWRSYENVVEGNNYIFEKVSDRFAELYSNLSGECKEDTSIAKAYDGLRQKPHKKESGRVECCFADKDMQLPLLVSKLEDLRKTGVRSKDICILLRYNKKAADIAEYMLLPEVQEKYPELKAGGYLSLVTDRAFKLSDDLALTLLMDTLNYLARPTNALFKGKLLMSYVALKGEDSEASTGSLGTIPLDQDQRDQVLPEALHQDSEELLKLRALSLQELVYKLIDIYELNNSKYRSHSAYIYKFLNAISQFVDNHIGTIPEFIDYWNNTLSKKELDSSAVDKGIRVMTIHGSKGLEFHSVILPFVEEPFKPKGNKVTDLWCKKRDDFSEPFDRLPLFPIKFSEKGLKDSFFREDYLREVEMRYMDILNLCYVAFTRAEANLIALCEISKPKDSKKTALDDNGFSNILYNILSSPEETFFHQEEAEDYELFALGEALAPFKEDEKEKVPSPFDTTIETKMPMDFQLYDLPSAASFVLSKRAVSFYENQEEQGVTVSEQNQEAILDGILNHAIFEQIVAINDVPRAVKTLVVKGLLAAADEQKKIDEVMQKISNEKVNHWFDGSWRRVYNECDILIRDHEQFSNRRPDRVMCSDTETIVVDYKFGEPHAKYANQVQDYMKFLQEMDCPNVKGYIWYVNLDKIDEVTL